MEKYLKFTAQGSRTCIHIIAESTSHALHGPLLAFYEFRTQICKCYILPLLPLFEFVESFEVYGRFLPIPSVTEQEYVVCEGDL